MSTFSGLSTALSSLVAQRQALDVAGQNVANANTAGYTRQRADLTAVRALSAPSMHSSVQAAGNGVNVTGITRMGDVFLDARVRAQTASSSFAGAQAASLSRLETTVTEPSDAGVAAALDAFWAGWHDVANKADDGAARKVLLGDARALAEQLGDGRRAVETQWAQMRTETDTLTTEVNSTAQAVAHLNEQIRSILVSGGSANELVDQRNLLVTTLSDLVGASARERADGTLDVMVGGNALVRGDRAHTVTAHGSHLMAEAVSSPADRVVLRWAATGTPLETDGGRLASHLTDLAAGGLLDRSAQAYDTVATRLATTVNGVHSGGVGLDGVGGRDFFRLEPGLPPATGLVVALTHPDQVAAAGPGRGALDGSVADAITQVGASATGPDAAWRGFVVDLGVRTRAADQRAVVAEDARATAEGLQLAQASVDLDEESIAMLAHQRAYEGAARVLTAIDEMLDVLINRTGVVGR